jgi:hypothetical protein
MICRKRHGRAAHGAPSGKPTDEEASIQAAPAKLYGGFTAHLEAVFAIDNDRLFCRQVRRPGLYFFYYEEASVSQHVETAWKILRQTDINEDRRPIAVQ